MASASSATLRLRPLGKRNMARLRARAKRIGVAPEDYARQLLENALTLQHQAETMTAADILGPMRANASPVDEEEIVKLVEKVRSEHNRNAGRGKRR